MVIFGEFLKTWSLQSNSVTRQVTLNKTQIGGKCENCKFLIFLFFRIMTKNKEGRRQKENWVKFPSVICDMISKCQKYVKFPNHDCAYPSILLCLDDLRAVGVRLLSGVPHFAGHRCHHLVQPETFTEESRRNSRKWFALRWSWW